MGVGCSRRKRSLPSQVSQEELATTVFRPDRQGIPRAHRGAPLTPPAPEPHQESRRDTGPDAAGGPHLPFERRGEDERGVRRCAHAGQSWGPLSGWRTNAARRTRFRVPGCCKAAPPRQAKNLLYSSTPILSIQNSFTRGYNIFGGYPATFGAGSTSVFACLATHSLSRT